MVMRTESYLAGGLAVEPEHLDGVSSQPGPFRFSALLYPITEVVDSRLSLFIMYRQFNPIIIFINNSPMMEEALLVYVLKLMSLVFRNSLKNCFV